MSYTKGKAKAERWSGSNTDPSWLVSLGGKIRFQTVGSDDEANAAELVHRWNSQPDLLEACEDGLKDLQRLMLRLDTSEVDETIKKLQTAIKK